MKILNFGSMNIDYVYQVDHILMPGETAASSDLQIYPGGKGLNQSIALAKAGAQVYHAGMIGEEGSILQKALHDAGVHTELIRKIPGKSGHTIIQVDAQGQNSILLYGGANRALTEAYIQDVLEQFSSEDIVLLQNETNLPEKIIDLAAGKGMQVILNPSPYDAQQKHVDLHKVSMILINEIEGFQMSGQKEPSRILQTIHTRFPRLKIVLTLGAEGAWYSEAGKEAIYQEACKVKAVDTTAAGDTFTGYFLARLAEGAPVKEALQLAAGASAIAVTRKGASTSVPMRSEVEE